MRKKKTLIKCVLILMQTIIHNHIYCIVMLRKIKKKKIVYALFSLYFQKEKLWCIFFCFVLINSGTV